MGIAEKHELVNDEQNSMDTLFDLLDKGIDDMESGKMLTVDEAFKNIKERLKNVL